MSQKKVAKMVSYSKYGYLFVLPFIITFLIFHLYPIIYTINLSFTDLKGWNVDYNYVGFKNFEILLNNQLFIRAFKNTVIIWIINFVPQIVLALALAAWFTDVRLKLKSTGFFKVVFYLPNIITAASVSILFFALFSYPVGPVNQILLQFGVIDEAYEFFRGPWATRLIVAFIQFWMWYGQTMIVLIAGILGISPTLYESAMIDGANSRQMFWQITVPLLRPILLFTFITSLIGGLQMFDIPFLLTNGNPDYAVETVTMFIYKQAFQGGRNYYFAAAASVILLVVIAIFSALVFRMFKERTPKRKKVGAN